MSESNRRVSEWIVEHLSVAVAPFPERDELAAVEAAVVRRLDPPLNLGHCLPSQARAGLRNYGRRSAVVRRME